jgi:hypothetical protein
MQEGWASLISKDQDTMEALWDISMKLTNNWISK